jgi:hypothetical protein
MCTNISGASLHVLKNEANPVVFMQMVVPEDLKYIKMLSLSLSLSLSLLK